MNSLMAGLKNTQTTFLGVAYAAGKFCEYMGAPEVGTAIETIAVTSLALFVRDASKSSKKLGIEKD